MKIKLDENLPEALVPHLQELGHDVSTARAEGLASHPDEEVWRAASEENRFLITQDTGFGDLRRLRGPHDGVLLIRLPKPGRTALFERVLNLFTTQPVEDWAGKLVVASAIKVRVVRPERR